MYSKRVIPADLNQYTRIKQVMKQDKERMSQIIEINKSMQQKLNSIDHLLQTVENEVEPSFQLPKSSETSYLSQFTHNNVLKRARSGEHERRITELQDQRGRQTKGQKKVKSSRSSNPRFAANVFVSTEVGQVVTINKHNGQFELVQLAGGKAPATQREQTNNNNRMQNADLSRYPVQDLKVNDEVKNANESPIKKQQLVENPFELAKLTPHGKQEEQAEKKEQQCTLLRNSNIRKNDFAGYADEEACFDMLDKYYGNKPGEGTSLAVQNNQINQQQLFTPGLEKTETVQNTNLQKQADSNTACSLENDQAEGRGEFQQEPETQKREDRDVQGIQYNVGQQYRKFKNNSNQARTKLGLSKNSKYDLGNTHHSRHNQSTTLNQSSLNKTRATPTKTQPKCHQINLQQISKPTVNQSLLKHNKSKPKGLHKKNSVHMMPLSNVQPPAAVGKSKLEEKRADSGQVRNRHIKKFNSISPKMQDAIAQGLNLKPTFVDPNKLENRELKTIENGSNQTRKDRSNVALVNTIKGMKGGLAAQIQCVVNNHSSNMNVNSNSSSKMMIQKTKISNSRQDSLSGERQNNMNNNINERKEFKMTKFKITPGPSKIIQKSMTNILQRPLQKVETKHAKPSQDQKPAGIQITQPMDRPKSSLQVTANGLTKPTTPVALKTPLNAAGDKVTDLNAKISTGQRGGNQPIYSLMSETVSKIGQRAAAMECSRLQRKLQQVKSPNDVKNAAEKQENKNVSKPQATKDLNSDFRVKTKELSIGNANQLNAKLSLDADDQINKYLKDELKQDQTDLTKKNRKTRNDRGKKILDMKSSKQLTRELYGNLGAQPSPRLMTQSNLSVTRRNKKSPQNEDEKIYESYSHPKPSNKNDQSKMQQSSDVDSQKMMLKSISNRPESKLIKQGPQMDPSRSSTNKVPQLIHCSESPIQLNTQSPMKQETMDSPSMLKDPNARQKHSRSEMSKHGVNAANSQSSKKQHMSQLSQLSKFRDRKAGTGLTGSAQSKVIQKKKSMKQVQPGQLNSQSKQKPDKPSEFEAAVPSEEDGRGRAEYLQKEMNKVNLSPINKFQIDQVQADEEPTDSNLVRLEDNTQSIVQQSNAITPIQNLSISQPTALKRKASMDSQRDKDKNQNDLAGICINAANTLREGDLQSTQNEGNVLISKIDLDDNKNLIQMDESCIAPSDMTTSTQRVRLKLENQALKDQIEQIQRMLMQKDMSLQEKNDQLNLMQKRLEGLQGNQEVVTGQMANDPRLNGPDAIYKSIDRGQPDSSNKLPNLDNQPKIELSDQQAKIQERKKLVNTMRFCSFDQDNNLNQINQKIVKPDYPVELNLQNPDVEVLQAPLMSDGNEDEAAKIRDSLYYTQPAPIKPPVVQLRRPSRMKNNRYSKGCYDAIENVDMAPQTQPHLQEKDNKGSMVLSSDLLSKKPAADTTSQRHISPKNNKYSTQCQHPNNVKSEIYLSSSFQDPNQQSQMSASFSSKRLNKEVDTDDCANQGSTALAPGIVNYTESVISSAVLSEAGIPPGERQIEPALQQQMDQLRSKLTRYLNVKKND